MDPLLAGLLIQGGAGVLGELFSSGDSAEQQRLIREAMAQFEGLSPPELEAIAAEQMGPSAMQGVAADPSAVAAQRAALEELMRVARSGGMRLEDRAMQNEALSRSSRAESAGRQRIADDMAARGVGGSGAELAMQLSNQQASAQRGAEASQQAAAQAQRRALDAMMQGGRFAGQMRGQDFDEKARRAQAADMVSRYNADARQRAAYFNANLPQQEHDNRYRIAQGKAGALAGGAGAAGQRANDTRGLYAGIGKAGYDIATAYEDPEKKKQQGGY